nr:RteC domain-containing protein [Bacteroides thetaiotaomicron]
MLLRYLKKIFYNSVAELREIRNRKKSRTQFLDKLKDKIQKMMEELDG